jgi:hypothetical protein
MESTLEFLDELARRESGNVEAAVALMWFLGHVDPGASTKARALCQLMEKARFPRQNSTRMEAALRKDRRVVRRADGTFHIRAAAANGLEEAFGSLLQDRPVRHHDGVLPAGLFKETRGYIGKVVDQLNASYEAGLHDCCAVMCRRLLETLIIEVYEGKGFAEDLKGTDNRFMMFSGLLGVIENEKRFTLGRNALDGLKAFKRLGDQSAHDRHFNARADDIKRIRDGLRSATEALVNLANFKKDS